MNELLQKVALKKMVEGAELVKAFASSLKVKKQPASKAKSKAK